VLADLPRFEARALAGAGVFDTLKGISERVLRRLSQRFGRGMTAAGTAVSISRGILTAAIALVTWDWHARNGRIVPLLTSFLR
jgi:hypothetical protein